MKGDAKALFTPAPEPEEDEAEGETEDTGDGVDDLLGNAFDAFTDGDREGFIRSLKAAIGPKE